MIISPNSEIVGFQELFHVIKTSISKLLIEDDYIKQILNEPIINFGNLI